MDILFTFKNTHVVMMAEKILIRGGINVTVLPLPAQISAGCGLCISVEEADRENAVQALAKNSVTGYEAYTKATENGKIVYTKDRPDC